MFTARYGLSPYITQIRLVFKRLIRDSLHVFDNWGGKFKPLNGVLRKCLA